MVKQYSALEESFNQLNATLAMPHVLSVLDLEQPNALHVELALTLRDGLVQRLLVQVTWLNLELASLSRCLGLMVESFKLTSGLSTMQEHRTRMFKRLVEPVKQTDLPSL